MLTDDEIERAYRQAQAAWPGIEVARSDFVGRWERSLAQWSIPEGAQKASLRKSRPDDPPALATNDLYLAAAIECGDRAAWERFYETYFPFARNVAASFAVNSQEGEDVAQSFCADIREHIRNFSGRGSLHGWLGVSLRNRVCSHGRRLARRREDSLDEIREREEESGQARVDSDRGRGEEAIRNHADRERCRSLLQRLTREGVGALEPRDRHVLFYKVVRGLSQREIAGLVYQVNEATVSRWVKDALRNFRQRLRFIVGTLLRTTWDEILYCMGLLRGRGWGGIEDLL